MVTAQNLPLWTQWLLMLVQVGALLALIAYVWKTWQMASAAVRSAEASSEAVQEMRKAREEEMSPYVVIYFDGPSQSGDVDLVIRNVGRTAAYRVSFEFDRPLSRPSQRELLMLAVLENGVEFLPPGYEIRTFFDMAHSVFPEDGESGSWRVGIAWDSMVSKPRQHTEQILSLEMLRGILYAPRKGIDDVAKSVARIQQDFKRLVAGLDQLAPGQGRDLVSHLLAARGPSAPATSDDWKEAIAHEVMLFRPAWQLVTTQQQEVLSIHALWYWRLHLWSSAVRLAFLCASGQEHEVPVEAQYVGEAANRLLSCGPGDPHFVGNVSREDFLKAANELMQALDHLQMTLNQESTANEPA